MAAARMNHLRLQREMAARGWERLRPDPCGGLERGNPLPQLQKIAVAIARTPAIPEAVELLRD
jgi:hypothetical protein